MADAVELIADEMLWTAAPARLLQSLSNVGGCYSPGTLAAMIDQQRLST
jgi:hypothetical protein